MKILKQGTHPEDRWHRGVCYTCFTEIEFQGKEAERSDSDSLNIDCPVCDGMISCDASKYQVVPYSQEAPATWKDI